MQVERIMHLVLSITRTSHVHVVSFDIIMLYFSQLCVHNTYSVNHKLFQIQLLALC